MKILKFKFLAILLAFVALGAGCSDDSEEEVSPYVGNYVISHAEVAEVVSIKTVQMGTIPIPVGTDITQAIQTALLSAVTCSSASKSYVELRKDFSMYLSCEGQNPLNAGTWQEIDQTTLNLNMNNAAIPSSPTGFALAVTNIVQNATGLRGKTSVPIPKAMVAALVAPLTLDPTVPVVIPMSFFLDFARK
jgi:hypothetical protein